MPTYGYRCTECNVEFERFQKMTDPPVTQCPNCGGAVKKLLYPVGIQFKGDGFYVNDYAKTSEKSKPASESGAADAKTDTKTVGKSETNSGDSGTTATPPASSAAPASSDAK